MVRKWLDRMLARSPVEASLGQLTAARLAIFAVLAIDAVLAMAHAPRYGTGFVVANLPGLEPLEPSRLGFLGLQTAIFAAAVAMIWGVATRLACVVGAICASLAYFTSQVDSYQHHYLVVLLWWVFCFMPWRAPPLASATKPMQVPSGAYRVVLALLAIVYLWAAVAKCHAEWISGQALRAQLPTGWVAKFAAVVPGGYQTLALGILATEFKLAVVVWQRRWAAWAWTLGMALHVGILFTPLDIGLFSWLMIALYVLVSPAAWWRRWPLPRLSTAQRVGGALVFGAALGIAVAYVGDVRQDYYRYWAGFARRTGNTADATYAYGRLVEVDPSNWRAYYQLGLLRKAAGDVDAAQALFRTAQRHPTDPDPWTEEAVILLERGDAAGAIQRLERALALAPGDRRASAYLARLRGQ